MVNRSAVALSAAFAALTALTAVRADAQSKAPVVDARITVHNGRPAVNRFDPRTTFGAGIDGHGAGVVRRVFTVPNIAAMKSVGFGMTSYRLRTELGVRAWHWNPRGRWSDAAHARGYWISNESSTAPINLTFGYRLPRRGTTDENDNSAYSRIDDGDTATFWKSNPYLDHRFTGTADSLLPQWVIVDLGAPQPVNGIHIRWGAPYAAEFKVQWWRGENVHDIDEHPPGRWVTFTGGRERDGHGGDDLRHLGDAPPQRDGEATRSGGETVRTRFVRIVMSRGRIATPRSDPRDSAGYAIRELAIGVFDADTLRDIVRHGAASSQQSTTYASSTDPWHRAQDIDTDLEQPGFDRLFRSTLTFGRPAMVPVPVLYGTPEDAAAEVRFLRRRGYSIGRIEMGEEPDGQFVTPEDYATLYAQVARAIRADWPSAPLGGPGFQGLESRVMFAWPADSAGDGAEETWIPRFLAAIRARGRPGDFTFFSFEWYPWDNVCANSAPQLAAASARLTDRLARITRDGLPPEIPRIIAEYGYSAFAGQAQVDMAGALLNADIVGRFLMLGGQAAFLYGWEPTTLDKSPRCDTWGNNMLFLADDQRRIRARVATYYGARLLTQQWTLPRGGAHELFAAESDALDTAGNELLSAYVLRRPDGTWSTLVVNKDPVRTYRVTMAFDAALTGSPASTRVIHSFSSTEYEWRANGQAGRPARSAPPRERSLRAGEALELPAYSLTVVHGTGPRP